MVLIQVPFLDQIFICLSADPVAITSLGNWTTDQTAATWPEKVEINLNEFKSHNFAVWSQEEVNIVLGWAPTTILQTESFKILWQEKL